MTEKSHYMYMLDRLGLIDCSHPFLLGLDPHECYYFIIIQLYYKYDVIFFFFTYPILVIINVNLYIFYFFLENTCLCFYISYYFYCHDFSLYFIFRISKTSLIHPYSN